MSNSRLEKFIYAICSMEVSDLPAPLSRIEKLWNCLITGETPDFEPQSRNEKYLMAMLGLYKLDQLPTPISRGEKLLYKIAVGETDLSDVPGYLSRYEELLKYLIENGGIGGGDFEYVLYTINQSLYTLYTTAEKPVKSAILTGYTLVNLATQKSGRFNGTRFLRIPLSYTLNSNRNYFVNFIVKESTLTDGVTCRFKNTSTGITLGSLKSSGIIAVNTNLPDILEIYIDNTDDVTNGLDAFIDDIMVIEYQDGMENCNIPYFTGMQSVKMPVLTTSNEDGTKTNILTVNEDVTLRGIGNVRDTLDCLTGEVTQRIGEIVLDGSEEFNKYPDIDGFSTSNFYTQISSDFRLNSNLLCDKLKVSTVGKIQHNLADVTDEEAICINVCYIKFRINKSKASTVDELKSYLNSNPITVQCLLATESIKTVDLTTVDQDGQPTKLKSFNDVTHVEIKADNLIPSVNVEVATKINETLATLDPQQLDISNTQNKLGQTIDEQTENTDATMLATTEIYEQTL